MMKKAILLLIRLYQKTLSIDHGPLRVFKPYGQCKFYPTCSEYTYQAIERYGMARGLFAGLKRIGRCNPWNDGGMEELL